MATHEQFNNHADTFLKRMAETFPKEQKISTYSAKFNLLRTIDSKKPVELFMESIIPYGEQILTKNENFFKQSDHVNKAESISGKMGLIKYWDSMSEEVRNTIWEFIQGLYILGMGALNKIPELQDMIELTNFKG